MRARAAKSSAGANLQNGPAAIAAGVFKVARDGRGSAALREYRELILGTLLGMLLALVGVTFDSLEPTLGASARMLSVASLFVAGVGFGIVLWVVSRRERTTPRNTPSRSMSVAPNLLTRAVHDGDRARWLNGTQTTCHVSCRIIVWLARGAAQNGVDKTGCGSHFGRSHEIN